MDYIYIYACTGVADMRFSQIGGKRPGILHFPWVYFRKL